MNSICVATIRAYEIKAELGGGFRGVYRSAASPVDGSIEEIKSEVLPTIEAARYFAKNAGYEKHPGATVAVIGRSSGIQYRANLWVRS